MLTKTNQPEACVARKQSASYYALLPFVCTHSSDFLINILCLRIRNFHCAKKVPLQAVTEPSPLQVPRCFSVISFCWWRWLQLLWFSLAENWRNSHAHLRTWAYASRDGPALQNRAACCILLFQPRLAVSAFQGRHSLTCLWLSSCIQREIHAEKINPAKIIFLSTSYTDRSTLNLCFMSMLWSSIGLLYLNLGPCS